MFLIVARDTLLRVEIGVVANLVRRKAHRANSESR